jgi:hypothetical protein
VTTLDDSEYRLPDTTALTEAYKLKSGVVVHGDQMYLAGTKGGNDLLADAALPFGLMPLTSQRYKNARAALQKAGGRVTHIVGHSLGGAIAVRLLEDAEAGRLGPQYRSFQVRTYGAPLLDSGKHPNVQAFRRRGDPISMLDKGARSTPAPLWNPHSHAGFVRSTARSTPAKQPTKSANYRPL